MSGKQGWSFESVPRGVKDRALLKVSQRADGSEVGFPLLVARGQHQGPVFCAVSGVHGDEFEGGEAIREFWRQIDVSELQGVFVGIPTLNVPALETKHRASHLDHIPQDMGRMFPEVERGYLSGLVAKTFFREIALHSDAIIDMHSGGTLLEITPCTIFVPDMQATRLASSESLAVAAGLPFLRHGTGQWHGTLCEAACGAGVPAITTEIGGEGRCGNAEVNLAIAVLKRLAGHLGMISRAPAQTTPRTVVKVHYLFAQKAGLFRPMVQLRDRVERGAVVGVVRDIFGDTLEELVAPFDAVVIARRSFPAIHGGELTVGLGQILEEIA